MALVYLVSYIIVGLCLRTLCQMALIATIRAGIKDKKKKKKVSVSIKDENSLIFIGMIGFFSFFYFLAIDISTGLGENFNSIVWFGMFLPEIVKFFSFVNKRIAVRAERNRKAREKVLEELRKKKEKEEKINEQNAYYLNKMLRSIT